MRASVAAHKTDFYESRCLHANIAQRSASPVLDVVCRLSFNVPLPAATFVTCFEFLNDSEQYILQTIGSEKYVLEVILILWWKIC